MGATAAAPIAAPGAKRKGGCVSSMYYVYWYDTSYPNGEYSGYQDMLPQHIYGIPYKVSTKHSAASRFLNTSLACTKYIAIITGKKKKHLVKEINGSPSVMHIYIIKPFAEKLEKWVGLYDKVRVFREFQSMVYELRQILNPLTPLNELVVDTKTAIEYMAHPNPITMFQQTVSALEDEKAQQDDQLLYKTLYSLTLQLIFNTYTQAKKIPMRENALSAYLKNPTLHKDYLKLLKLAIRLDQYPLLFSGVSVPEVRKILASEKGDMEALIRCLKDIDPNLPLKFLEQSLVKKFHQTLIGIIGGELGKKVGHIWKRLYYPAMYLSDLDFCVKTFMQILLDTAETEFSDAVHAEFAATLSQASIASDIRVSSFNDVLERTKPASPEESFACLSNEETQIALSSCALNDVLIFDINTSECQDLLLPLVPLMGDRRCKVYKMVQDFYIDSEAHDYHRNKVVYAVIPPKFPRLEFDKLLNVFVKESITPILIIYTPKATTQEISKAMFKNKWIITTVYAETFKDIVDYVNDAEIDLSKEMIYYSRVYSDFSKTLSKFKTCPETQLSTNDSGEYDVGFEILNEINSTVFTGLVEELSLGTKLIGSLHYYMWLEFKSQGKEQVYWESYAPLFAITPKVMNILDVNFGKNILRAYTLQTNPPFYKMLNDAFRGGNPAKISKYRGFYVILHDLIKKGILRYHTGSVYRGTYFNPAVLKGLKKGQKVFSTCFTSTSKVETVAREFARKTKRNVLLEIELHPRGFSNVDIYSEKVSKYPEEQEVLLLPFTAFEIASFSEEDNLTVISMKEVLQDVEVANLKGIDYYN